MTVAAGEEKKRVLAGGGECGAYLRGAYLMFILSVCKHANNANSVCRQQCSIPSIHHPSPIIQWFIRHSFVQSLAQPVFAQVKTLPPE